MTAVCERVLEATPAAVTAPATGNSKRTALVGLRDGREVVVQYRARERPLDAEVAVTRAVAGRTDLPAAPVLAAGTLTDPPVSYFVTRRVPGDDLHERFAGLPAADRERLARTLGRHLAAVLGGLPADDIRLFPWDYRPGNVIVRDAEGGPEVAAVLDWGEPLAAPAGLSAAKAEFTLADWYVRVDADVRALREAYRAGYREVRPFPEAGFGAFRLLGIADSAADSRGEVTRPRYPVVDAEAAVAFHRDRIEAALDRLD